MDKNFRLVIEYDGTNYHGWQRQASDNSIQSEIEAALAKMTGSPVKLIGSGRTDAGVHAFGQSANFCCNTRLSAEAFQKGLNSLLPGDIVIKTCFEAEADFHARFAARGKTYQYRIYNAVVPSALCLRYSWHIRRKLDMAAMRKAAGILLGSHDFKAFQGQGSEVFDTVREIYKSDFTSGDDRIIFEIRGNGFLRYMVRNIVGTLVDIGMGKKTEEDFQEILNSGDRNRAGITAPPQGLFLMEVIY